MKTKLRALIVDDSQDMVELLVRHMTEMGLDTFAGNNVVEAISILENSAIDVVITDMRMPEVSGYQLVKYMSQHFPTVPILVVTGYPDLRDAVEVVKMGAMEYLIKPFTFEELKAAIDKVIEDPNFNQVEENQEKEEVVDAYHGIIGRSEPMQKLYATIRRTKNNLATVLITGESGTGKEMVARAIHYTSQFSSAPFVPVNCGAIPEQLLESELFGHVKGSFTGAVNNRIGFFQAANGGSLFLDEISNTTLAVQAKLLRAIQEKEVTMLGDTKSQKVTLRLISASNTNLLDLVGKNLFREDLYYRLNIISIHIPPLRERHEDIPLLVDYFNEKYANENAREPLVINKRIMQVLEEYAWPGNVRELENFIHRMVILCDKKVDFNDLPDYMKMNISNRKEETSLLTLKEVEKNHILKVLSATNNNKTQAAKILGIDRKTLRQKLVT